MKNEALEYDFFIFATISACGKLSGNEVPQTTRFVGNPNKPALVISHSILCLEKFLKMQTSVGPRAKLNLSLIYIPTLTIKSFGQTPKEGSLIGAEMSFFH